MIARPIEKVVRLLEPIDEQLPCKNRLRCWAMKNAYTLLLLAVIGITIIIALNILLLVAVLDG